MKYSDIKVAHIYNVIFDPVRDCEFNGNHLALVLKKNRDNTAIVLPLTSSPRGVGKNKIKLTPITSLPTSFQGQDSYAVYNQVRTVNSSRFIALKEGGNKVESTIDPVTWSHLFALCIQDLLFDVSQDEKIVILKELHRFECEKKAINLAYEILSLRKVPTTDENAILLLEQEINESLSGISYFLNEDQKNDGIQKIFDEIQKKSVLEIDKI